jgi:replicative DNA helicase
MNARIENVVLSNLLLREEYLRKVIPFLKEEYFLDNIDKILFRHISKYVEKPAFSLSSIKILLAVKKEPACPSKF